MRSFVISILFLSVFLPSILQAGICVRGIEFYLECLEGKHVDEPDCLGPAAILECIGMPRKQHQRWGLAAERQVLSSTKKLPHRDRLINAAIVHLNDPGARVDALVVLAFQGIREAGDTDVFVELVRQHSHIHNFWYALAALQDPRSVKFAGAQFVELRKSESTLRTSTRERLMEIVDCLYHFRTAESRKLLKQLAESETDDKLKRYIRSTAGV